MSKSKEQGLARVDLRLSSSEKEEWEKHAGKYISLSDMIRLAVRSFILGLTSPKQNSEITKVLEELRDIQRQNRKDAAELRFYKEMAPKIDAPEDLTRKTRLLVTHGQFTTGEIAFITGITREETVLILANMKDLEQEEQTARWKLQID